MPVVTVDFDGTLYEGSSFNAMFQTVKNEYTWKKWFVIGKGFIIAGLIGAIKGKQAFRHSFFKTFAKSFKGQTKQRLEHFFTLLIQERVDEVNHSLIKKIREHQSNGDKIIILSGALNPFLAAFIQEYHLNVHVISTQLLYDNEGKCTGEIGKIVNGEEKVVKLIEWLGQNSIADGSTTNGDIWAYADSFADLPLLNFVKHPVIVNPNEHMKQIAAKNKWPVF